jgi:hypothetical protein
LSAPTISSVSRAISSGGIADGRSVESAAAGFASVLVSSVIASSEQILRFEQRLRKASTAPLPFMDLSSMPLFAAWHRDIPPADYMVRLYRLRAEILNIGSF